MKSLKIFLGFVSLSSLIFGMIMILNPSIYGILLIPVLEPSGEFVLQIHGASFIDFAVWNFQGIRTEDINLLKIIISSQLVVTLLAVFIGMSGSLDKVFQGFIGWQLIFVYSAYSLAFAFYYIQLSKKVSSDDNVQ
jgi:hypothetical protein